MEGLHEVRVVHAGAGGRVRDVLVKVARVRERGALQRSRHAARKEALHQLVDVSLLMQRDRAVGVVAHLDPEEIDHRALIEDVPGFVERLEERGAERAWRSVSFLVDIVGLQDLEVILVEANDEDLAVAVVLAHEDTRVGVIERFEALRLHPREDLALKAAASLR
ncbi:MAG: hypothetical protein ACK56F_29180, partial [bacterium]